MGIIKHYQIMQLKINSRTIDQKRRKFTILTLKSENLGQNSLCSQFFPRKNFNHLWSRKYLLVEVSTLN